MLMIQFSYSGMTTWTKVKESASEGLKTITKWLDFNLLTLNIMKTRYITFSIKDLQPDCNFRLETHSIHCYNPEKCTCHTLSSTNCIKYLGVEIDQKLNWKQHITSLKTRIRKLIPIFKRLRNLRDHKTNKIVYLALCQSIIMYGISAWGGANKSSIITIERAQRCILKIINFKHYRYPTTKLYKEFGVLNIRQLFIKNIVTRQKHLVKRDNFSARRSH